AGAARVEEERLRLGEPGFALGRVVGRRGCALEVGEAEIARRSEEREPVDGPRQVASGLPTRIVPGERDAGLQKARARAEQPGGGERTSRGELACRRVQISGVEGERG